MIAYSDISTYVLAGGKSTRMGSSKANLMWHHKTFIEHIADAVIACKLEVNIIAEKNFNQKMQVNVIPDLIPDKGPLGGIYTALKHSIFSYNLILGCDMPCISTQSIHAFISRAKYEMINIAYVQNQMQPLFALYHVNLLPDIEKAIASNELAMHKFVEKHAYHCINMNEFAEEFRNINTKEDYQSLIQKV